MSFSSDSRSRSGSVSNTFQTATSETFPGSQLSLFRDAQDSFLKRGPIPEIRASYLVDDGMTLGLGRRRRNSSVDQEEFIKDQLTSGWS